MTLYISRKASQVCFLCHCSHLFELHLEFNTIFQGVNADSEEDAEGVAAPLAQKKSADEEAANGKAKAQKEPESEASQEDSEEQEKKGKEKKGENNGRQEKGKETDGGLLAGAVGGIVDGGKNVLNKGAAAGGQVLDEGAKKAVGAVEEQS